MKFIIEIIKTAIGGGTTKLIIYGLFFIVFIILGMKACKATKEVHYIKYVLPHLKPVRDSLSRSIGQKDSIVSKYFVLQEKALLDSVLNKDISDKQQGLIRDMNSRIKILKKDCRDVLVIREKYGLFGNLKSIDSSVIVK